ncbi:MAG: hypothetical protein FWH11_02105 [Micrococcales bacterium]|nr:hypothetical protein [Micrococcales bacterium]
MSIPYGSQPGPPVPAAQPPQQPGPAQNPVYQQATWGSVPGPPGSYIPPQAASQQAWTTHAQTATSNHTAVPRSTPFVHLKHRGGAFTLEEWPIFFASAGVFMLVGAALLLYYKPIDTAAVLAVVLLVMGALFLSGTTAKTVFDPATRTVTFRRMTKTVRRFDDFRGFEMVKLKSTLIPVGNHLNMIFETDGRTRPIRIKTYGPVYSTKKAQQVCDEILTAMGVDGATGR